MTYDQAAIEVLRRSRKALHFKKITEIAVREKLLAHVGMQPEETMFARLKAMAEKTGERKLIDDTGSGFYNLVPEVRKRLAAEAKAKAKEVVPDVAAAPAVVEPMVDGGAGAGLTPPAQTGAVQAELGDGKGREPGSDRERRGRGRGRRGGRGRGAERRDGGTADAGVRVPEPGGEGARVGESAPLDGEGQTDSGGPDGPDVGTREPRGHDGPVVSDRGPERPERRSPRGEGRRGDRDRGHGHRDRRAHRGRGEAVADEAMTRAAGPVSEEGAAVTGEADAAAAEATDRGERREGGPDRGLKGAPRIHEGAMDAALNGPEGERSAELGTVIRRLRGQARGLGDGLGARVLDYLLQRRQEAAARGVEPHHVLVYGGVVARGPQGRGNGDERRMVEEGRRHLTRGVEQGLRQADSGYLFALAAAAVRPRGFAFALGEGLPARGQPLAGEYQVGVKAVPAGLVCYAERQAIGRRALAEARRQWKRFRPPFVVVAAVGGFDASAVEWSHTQEELVILLDMAHLAQELVRAQVGIWQAPGGGSWHVDRGFWEQLKRG